MTELEIRQRLLWVDGVLSAEQRGGGIFRPDIHFLRGVLDYAGSINMYLRGRMRPRLSLNGDPAYITAFIAAYTAVDPLLFTQGPTGWKRPALLGILLLQGVQAQRMVYKLWPDDSVVTFETNRVRAAEIRDWISFAGCGKPSYVYPDTRRNHFDKRK